MDDHDQISDDMDPALIAMGAELESDLNLPCVLIITESSDNDIIIDAPGQELTNNDRIAMLVRALFVEMAEDIVYALAALNEDDDD